MTCDLNGVELHLVVRGQTVCVFVVTCRKSVLASSADERWYRHMGEVTEECHTNRQQHRNLQSSHTHSTDRVNHTSTDITVHVYSQICKHNSKDHVLSMYNLPKFVQFTKINAFKMNISIVILLLFCIIIIVIIISTFLFYSSYSFNTIVIIIIIIIIIIIQTKYMCIHRYVKIIQRIIRWACIIFPNLSKSK